jgi:hypothetical protein
MTGIVAFRTELLDDQGSPISSANPLPTSGGASGGGIDSYVLNDYASGTTLYIGKVKSEGTWLLQRYNTTTGEMRYANLSNNVGVATYTSAWSGRTGLVYGLFNTLTGV